MRRGVLALALLSLFACSSDPEGSLAITVGEEADALTRAPAPTSLVVDTIAQNGAATQIAKVALPASSIDLGKRDQTQVAAFSVTGYDAANVAVVRGETLYVELGALANQTLPLFVQRSGELARVPNGPTALAATKTTVVASRYVFLSTGTTGLLYDLLSLVTLSSTPTLPRPAKSVAVVDTSVLLVDENGATTLDLSTSATAEISAPNGGTWAEIAGGDRLGASDTSQYIVGATRLAGDPTARVLAISAQGAASFASLNAPRLGACATYVDGRGIFVYGGSATAAGAEIVPPGANTVGAALPYAPDPVVGCAAVTLDATHVLVVGGSGASGDTGAGLPGRVIDLTCTTTCAPVAWPDIVKLSPVQALPLAADAALVLGEDASGNSHAYRVSAHAGIREVALKNPRKGARLAFSPTGALLVAGGDAAGIEQYLE